MNSKLKKQDEIIKNTYFNIYDFRSVNYNPQSYIPRKSFYSTYFEQNQNNIPSKTLNILFFTYIAGVTFGAIMVVFNLWASSSMPVVDQKKYKYESFQEFKKITKDVNII
jgi:hypothetical protein